jgi:alanyl-tRNA synthetase
MNADAIRGTFARFFESRGHAIVPSSAVTPPDDDATLLFTNAGMVPFKPIFLGTRQPSDRRVANSQKCIRVSGKHNDLEEVGLDGYHHTFFEMLGNWSFGDYGKREAIAMAWELLTVVYGIEASRLHATIFAGDAEMGIPADEESRRLWTEVTDIDPSHIHDFGKSDNFWMMGDTGPCGPCTEIHIDRTPDRTAGGLINAGDARVMELWNLVFIEFNRDGSGRLIPLPERHVDTGMGLERIASVLQAKSSNYDTDLFAPTLRTLADLTGRSYGGRMTDPSDVAFRVVADHIRMLSFAISDGALPGPKGRGAAVRGVLRRASRFGWQRLGRRQPFLHELVPVVAATYSDPYPEVAAHSKRVAEVIRDEEESFLRTIDHGLRYFAAAANEARGAGGMIGAAAVFKLHATDGFPHDLTRQMAREEGLAIDEDGFRSLLSEHEAKSRRKAQAAVSLEGARGMPPTDDRPKWSGVSAEATILACVIDGSFSADGKLAVGVAGDLILDRTCFYTEAGGQAPDSGSIATATGTFRVESTLRSGDLVLHRGRVHLGTIRAGQPATLRVDEARAATSRNHTATHLIGQALRSILGGSVEQRGSSIRPDKLTWDFAFNRPVTASELREVEHLANAMVASNLPVTWEIMPSARAKAIPGIQAVFAEKYGEMVRVVTIGDGASVELCGGTHLARTGEVGLLKVVDERPAGRGIRRLTCVTAAEAIAHVQKSEGSLRAIAASLKCGASQVEERVEGLLGELRIARRDCAHFRRAALETAIAAMADATESIAGLGVVFGSLPPATIDEFGLPSAVAEEVRDEIRIESERMLATGLDVIVLAWPEGSSVRLHAIASDAARASGVDAGSFLRQAAERIGGSAGGNASRASGSLAHTDANEVAPAISAARHALAEQIGRHGQAD